jgi:hypothetical protein
MITHRRTTSAYRRSAIRPRTPSETWPDRGYGLRGPVNFDLDMSLEKTIPIHKSVNALIDVSAYNVTNSVIFGAPPVNTGRPSTFGTLTSQANNSRDIQLAFRLSF